MHYVQHVNAGKGCGLQLPHVDGENLRGAGDGGPAPRSAEVKTPTRARQEKYESDVLRMLNAYGDGFAGVTPIFN